MAIIDWRRALVVTHRWLGIGGGLLFVAWFASGIVMLYARMPELDPDERLARAPALATTSVTVSPSEAAAASGLPVSAVGAVRLGMLGDRPVYRFGAGSAVYADDGRQVQPLLAGRAVAIVAGLYPEHAGTLRHDARLTGPDQWTLQSRAYLPLRRIALGDAAGTEVYLAERTGDLVMKTTTSGRRWAYAGAVLHWLYFTPFRAHSTLWAQTIIWLSVAGCVLALSGLFWGLLRFSVRRGHRVGGNPTRSPYSGLLRWHHYAGLLFGVFTFTWILSGGLSMEPWSWHPGTAPTSAQREGVSGGALRAERLSTEAVRAAAETLTAASDARSGGGAASGSRLSLKEISLVQLLGEPYFVGHRTGGSLLVAATPGAQAFARFADEATERAARAAMPGIPVVDAAWLGEYDAYYYGRGYAAGSGPPLPVLRVRFADEAETWLYLDPARGIIARKEERLTRLNRWLYHGLHSLDFPGLYERRPLWDLLVIVLSVGGLAVSATTLLPGWRRLVRAVRRVRG